jgi:hypothetical protein
MPYSEGLRAVRKYYDPNWGTEKPAGEPVKWEVELRFYHSGYSTESFEIVAETAADAEKEAVERFKKSIIDIRADDCEVESVSVSAA